MLLLHNVSTKSDSTTTTTTSNYYWEHTKQNRWQTRSTKYLPIICARNRMTVKNERLAAFAFCFSCKKSQFATIVPKPKLTLWCQNFWRKTSQWKKPQKFRRLNLLSSFSLSHTKSKLIFLQKQNAEWKGRDETTFDVLIKANGSKEMVNLIGDLQKHKMARLMSFQISSFSKLEDGWF